MPKWADVASFAVLAAFAAAASMPARAASGESAPNIPDFSGAGMAWQTIGTNFTGVPGGPQPVGDDPAYPHVANAQGNPTLRVADLNNPNLTDAAKASLKDVNEKVIAGQAIFAREASCWPTGVPTYDLDQGLPLYFVQSPKEVTIIWEMDHQVRHIYLDVPHSANPKPSWYGESVGHYEGDTLVVDTIGQNTRTFVDNYRTPHSEKLHVVERFHLVNDGKNLQVDVALDDPATFKQPLHVTHRWRRVQPGPLQESSCAEAGAGFYAYDVEPIPTAAKPDF